MDLGLQGKVAVVTAATTNIGRAVALDLAAEGVKLISWQSSDGTDREAN